MANVLCAGVNNPFSILEFLDLSDRCAVGDKKDGGFLVSQYIPSIRKLENHRKSDGKTTPGIVDICIFDGASNLQNAGKIMSARFPRITVLHGAEHVMALLFQDVFSGCPEYVQLSNVCKKIRNVFGSTRHAPTAMFRGHTKKHNGGKKIGFIKVSECR